MHGEGGCGRQQRIIEVCLLVLLCGPEGEHSHGYALGERLREFGFSGSEISVSTLYRTLRGMEEAGWVTSGWAAGGPGPQRREYTITEVGRTALDEWAAVLQKRRERISRVLEGYAALGREPAVSVNEETLMANGRQKRSGGAHHPHAAKPAAKPAAKRAEKPERAEEPEAEAKPQIQRKQTESFNDYWD